MESAFEASAGACRLRYFTGVENGEVKLRPAKHREIAVRAKLAPAEVEKAFFFSAVNEWTAKVHAASSAAVARSAAGCAAVARRRFHHLDAKVEHRAGSIAWDEEYDLLSPLYADMYRGPITELRTR